MPTKIKASNAVTNAILDAAALYRVPAFRMQSRVLPVIGKGGRSRPMFFGSWTDDLGVLHHSGMADLLLQPRISISKIITESIPGLLPAVPNHDSHFKITVPLWVECKSGTGKLREDQIAFRDYVVKGGAFFLEAHDCADSVIDWFDAFGVTR